MVPGSGFTPYKAEGAKVSGGIVEDLGRRLKRGDV